MQRFAPASALILVMVCAALGSPVADATETPAERQRRLSRETGTISGRVVSAESGQPLEGVFVSAQYLGDRTDASGGFSIALIDPGTVQLSAGRRDMTTATADVEVKAGNTTTVEVALERAPPACCRLAGTWVLELALGSPRERKSSPDLPTAKGTVTFTTGEPDPVANRQRAPDDTVLDEFGRYDMDLTLLFGSDTWKSSSNTIYAGSGEGDILTEAEGYIYHGDRVSINFIPRMSHVGISLRGNIKQDKIVGTWVKRDFAPSLTGTFTMTREAPAPP